MVGLGEVTMTGAGMYWVEGGGAVGDGAGVAKAAAAGGAATVWHGSVPLWRIRSPTGLRIAHSLQTEEGICSARTLGR